MLKTYTQQPHFHKKKKFLHTKQQICFDQILKCTSKYFEQYLKCVLGRTVCAQGIEMINRMLLIVDYCSKRRYPLMSSAHKTCPLDDGFLCCLFLHSPAVGGERSTEQGDEHLWLAHSCPWHEGILSRLDLVFLFSENFAHFWDRPGPKCDVEEQELQTWQVTYPQLPLVIQRWECLPECSLLPLGEQDSCLLPLAKLILDTPTYLGL